MSRQSWVALVVSSVFSFTGCHDSNGRAPGDPMAGDDASCCLYGICDWLGNSCCEGSCDWLATYPETCICAEVLVPEGGDASVPQIVEGTLVQHEQALPPDHGCRPWCSAVTIVLVIETIAGERYRFSAWLPEQPSLTIGEWVRVQTVLEPYVFFPHFFLLVNGDEGLLLAAEDGAYGTGNRPWKKDVGSVEVDPEGTVVGRDMTFCARENFRTAGFSTGDEEVWVRTGESAVLENGGNRLLVSNHVNAWYDYIECTDHPHAGFTFSIVRQGPK